MEYPRRSAHHSDNRLCVHPHAKPRQREIAEHGHPGAVAPYVLSGEFETTFTVGSGLVIRASSAGTPVGEEPIELITDLALSPGDAVSSDQVSHHVMRNLGTEPLVLRATGTLAADQPGFLFVDASHS